MNLCAFIPDTCASTQASLEAVPGPAACAMPADQLLDRAIAALTAGDRDGLRALEAFAARAAAPLSWERYLERRAVYAALLGATARNLRVVRRASGRGEPGADRHGS